MTLRSYIGTIQAIFVYLRTSRLNENNSLPIFDYEFILSVTNYFFI